MGWPLREAVYALTQDIIQDVRNKDNHKTPLWGR